MKKTPHVSYLPIPTPDGLFMAAYSPTGLCHLEFPTKPSPPSSANPAPAQVRRWHAQTTRAVRAILQGRAPGPLPPLDLNKGTEFQRRVWKKLLLIPLGRTRSYGDIASALGIPGGARAVGGACGANPVPLIVPCHRVVASGGGLGGFSGGLDWKRRLLEKESGVRPMDAMK